MVPPSSQWSRKEGRDCSGWCSSPHPYIQPITQSCSSPSKIYCTQSFLSVPCAAQHGLGPATLPTSFPASLSFTHCIPASSTAVSSFLPQGLCTGYSLPGTFLPHIFTWLAPSRFHVSVHLSPPPRRLLCPTFWEAPSYPFPATLYNTGLFYFLHSIYP